MREAMATAEVGDDVMGEDPTVAALQERVATLLGKQRALFVPSGTMGNQICLGLLTSPGDEIIGEAECHLLLNEVGSVSRLWGCQMRPIKGRGGVMDGAEVEATVRDPDDIHYPRTAAIALENTNNYAGGVVLPLEQIDAMADIARRHGLALHMDGARLFNAQVACEIPFARLLRDVDTVSVCFSKGMGAPLGSVIASTPERIQRAVRLRKGLGGGMRQAGVVAAAALVALDESPPLMVHDHARARALAEELQRQPGTEVDLASVQTNIVVARVAQGTAPDVVRRLAERDVHAGYLDGERVRFVFHRDAGDDALQAAVDAVRAVLG